MLTTRLDTAAATSAFGEFAGQAVQTVALCGVMSLGRHAVSALTGGKQHNVQNSQPSF